MRIRVDESISIICCCTISVDRWLTTVSTRNWRSSWDCNGGDFDTDLFEDKSADGCLGEEATADGCMSEDITVDECLDKGFFEDRCWDVGEDSTIFGIDGEVEWDRFLEGIEGRTTGWGFEREIWFNRERGSDIYFSFFCFFETGTNDDFFCVDVSLE